MKKIIFFTSLIACATHDHETKLEALKEKSFKERFAYLRDKYPNLAKDLILYQIHPKFGKKEDRELLAKLSLLKTSFSSPKSKL